MKSETYNGLRAICGRDAVLTDPASLLGYENDALAFRRHRPDCVVIPGSCDELKRVIRFCRNIEFPYTLRGAGTSLSGGPVAAQGGLIIHLSRLRNILEINEEDLFCVVEPGVVLDRLNKALGAHGLFYPPDPSSGLSCTLGGNVAENAGGIRCFKYGVTAGYVLGLEIILHSGEAVTLGGPAGGRGMGNGPCWKSLIVGSEGILAAISKIWLRLKPLPEKIWTFLAGFKTMDFAMDAVVQLTRSSVMPVALEFMDNRVVQLVENSSFSVGLDRDRCYLLVEIDGPADLVNCQVDEVVKLLERSGAEDCKKTSDSKQRLELWKARKAFGGLLGQISPEIMSQDSVVPPTRISEVLTYIYGEADRMGVQALSAVHAGDGNMHPNFLFDAEKPGELKNIKRLGKKLMEKVVAEGGMITGEHGLGNDKLEYLPMVFTREETVFQKALLACFNPNHRLNPGKVFSGRDFRA
ncbi:FAD-binding oxidoreductase [Fibrobacterota bacterium]